MGLQTTAGEDTLKCKVIKIFIVLWQIALDLEKGQATHISAMCDSAQHTSEGKTYRVFLVVFGFGLG